MARVHVFEFEDQKWFPTYLRNYSTDFLQFLSNKTKLFRGILPIIEKGLRNSQTTQIIDLCSGGGGGLLWLNTELKKSNPDLKIILTDYFPNISAFKYMEKQAPNFTFVNEAIDARNIPENLKGLRTLFLSFHHFNPEDAKRILQNAVDSRSNIAIFEAQERSFASLLAMFFSPITVLLTTPFIRPFKFGRIIFTYLIPIIPIVTWWDGMVSSLRTYSVKEMKELVDSLNSKESFDWEIGKVRSGPIVNIYLLGTKK